jgi:hypothetical protein
MPQPPARCGPGVNADVPSLEAILVEKRDPHVNALGIKGVGEIGITGRRVRSVTQSGTPLEFGFATSRLPSTA